MSPRIDSDSMARFLTENLAEVPHEPVAKPVSIGDAVKAIQSSLHYTTFHDDSDEAIMLWTAWHLVRHAIGHGVGENPKANWRDEVWKCMRGLDDGKD